MNINDYENPADFWYAMAKKENEKQDHRYFVTSTNDKVHFQNYGFCDNCRTEDVKIMSINGVSLCGGCIRRMFNEQEKAYRDE